MSAWVSRLLPAVILVALSRAAAPAAAPPKVEDHGKLFSEGAIKEANDIIADIERRFKKDVRVEAYSEPPAAKAAEFQQHKKERAFRDRFFKAWAEERMKATGTNGVLILFYRDKEGYF